jgi:hypothetical protein
VSLKLDDTIVCHDRHASAHDFKQKIDVVPYRLEEMVLLVLGSPYQSIDKSATFHEVDPVLEVLSEALYEIIDLWMGDGSRTESIQIPDVSVSESRLTPGRVWRWV